MSRPQVTFADFDDRFNKTCMATVVARDAWLLPTLEKLAGEGALSSFVDTAESLWTEVVGRRILTDDQILTELAVRYRMKIADKQSVGPGSRGLLSEAIARRYHVIPISATDSAILVATADPNDLDAESALGFATGRKVRMLLASPSSIAETLDLMYQGDRSLESYLSGVTMSEFTAIEEDAPPPDNYELGEQSAASRPIIKLVDHIVAEGISRRASDIHLEPQEGQVLVTYRIDGVLRPGMQLPRSVGLPLVSRIKIMSGMDIADRMRPQDGRSRVSIDGKRVDLRVSTLPASAGEKVVIRILDQGGKDTTLDSLGVSGEDYNRLSHLIGLREGIVLVTGPTGSGKTTTLYAALRSIQQRGVNIVTVEDPVEYKLQGIVQVQVNEKAGLTFAAALRSILRQDPDVVLVGEIRDRETAGIAIQASLTGHLVLSTLHTNDAAGAIARLLDIGIEGYKLGAAVKGVVAQRLVRRLCVHCREATTTVSRRFRQYIPEGTTVYKAAGCAECGDTGYHSRLALTEVLLVSAALERAIAAGEPTDRLEAVAKEEGMTTLWDSGIAQIIAGVTDAEELLRVVEPPMMDPRPVENTPAKKPAGRTSTRAKRVTGSNVAMAPVNASAPTPTAPDLAFELVDEALAGLDLPVTKRVLVASRDADVLAQLMIAVDSSSATVEGVSDGVDALDAIDAERPDVVVLDCDLSRLDGIAVLGRMRSRSHFASIHVIVVSSDDSEAVEVEAFAKGANDFVVKPLRPRALAARIKQLTRKP